MPNLPECCRQCQFNFSALCAPDVLMTAKMSNKCLNFVSYFISNVLEKDRNSRYKLEVDEDGIS